MSEPTPEVGVSVPVDTGTWIDFAEFAGDGPGFEIGVSAPADD